MGDLGCSAEKGSTIDPSRRSRRAVDRMLRFAQIWPGLEDRFGQSATADQSHDPSLINSSSNTFSDFFVHGYIYLLFSPARPQLDMSSQYALCYPLDVAPSSDVAAHYPSSPASSVQSSSSDFSSGSISSSCSSANSICAPNDSVHASDFTDRYSSLHCPSRVTRSAPSRVNIQHPYARLFAKKDEVKRRKIWNHALEKNLFTPYELSTLGAPHRRTIYTSSLEAHIDRLHAQLLELGFWPVAFSELEPYKGLNTKTAKSMVASLQHDASVAKLKLLELERANEELMSLLRGQNAIHK